MRTLSVASLFALVVALPAQAVQLWGVMPAGGLHGKGVLFKYDSDRERYEVLHHFSGLDGAAPLGALLFTSDGTLYGVASEGGTGNAGVLFSFTPATRAFRIERELNGANGRYPQAPLIEGPDGFLYAVTTFGARADSGVVFRFNPRNGGYTVLHRFEGPDGANPRGHLTWHEGRLYGMTSSGGLHLRGVLFSLAPDGTDFQVHRNFEFGFAGNFPYGGLLGTGDGRLFGLTATGGGYVFAYDPAADVLTPLRDARGQFYGSLVQGRDGLLYAASTGSGNYGRGFIFSYDPDSGDFRQRFSFTPWYELGWGPQGSLTPASDGMLYGLASIGGKQGRGVLYRYSGASETYQPLVHLGGETGQSPAFTSLIEAAADVPTTRVLPALCGVEVSLDRLVALEPVAGAQSYEIEVYTDAELTDPTAVASRHNPRFLPAAIDGLAWGGSYFVRARANASGRYSEFGDVCELRVMAEPTTVPLTRIRAALAATPVSPYTRLRADAVPGAIRYDFEVRAAGDVLWAGGGRNGFTLQEIGLPDWQRSYEIRVRAHIGALPGDWGPDVTIEVLAEPLQPPVGAIRPVDCGVRERSIYHRLGAEPVPGATAYLFELYRENELLRETYSPVPSIPLTEIDGVYWGGQYSVRVRPDLGPLAGEFSPFCGLAITSQPAYGLASYLLRRSDCGASFGPGDVIRTSNGDGLTEYEWEFFADPEGLAPVATAFSKSSRLELAIVPGLEPSSSYWVRVRGNVGPFRGPAGGAMCSIHIDAGT